MLVILGAGGFAREVLCWLAPKGGTVVFFSDDVSARSVQNHEVVHSFAGLSGAQFIPGVGDPALRRILWERAVEAGLEPAPTVGDRREITIGDAEISDGGVICPGVRITTNVRIGKGVILNLNATVGHDTEIGEFTTVSPGALISGNCRIGSGCYIGTGASVREGSAIEDGAVLGMGAALVGKRIPAGEVWGGVPARRIK